MTQNRLLIILFSVALVALFSCSQTIEKDVTIYLNGRIYTCDSNFTVAEAMAVADGKILATGLNKDIQLKYPDADTTILLNNHAVYPGLFDAHCHFYALGRLESRLNCKGVSSWDSVLQMARLYHESNSEGWLLGRGWDQSLFKGKSYPDNEGLNKAFPNRPVLLRRVDGHAAIANAKALELVGIDLNSKIEGGEVEIKNGKLTGILLDNAVDQVMNAIPKESNAEIARYLLKAQELCFAVGLTSVTDAGLSPQILDVIDSLYDKGQLKIRINAMISANQEGLDYAKKHGPIEQERFRVKSFKIYGDGALGSRGALLKRPYCDRDNHSGLLLTPIDSIKKYCQWAANNNFQVCTHAIGDSANKLLLDIYSGYTSGKDLRWRIEHAQVVQVKDIALFGKYSVIPSVQPTHATSDMRWAENRICTDRLSGAYAYKSLLNAYGKIALGTDFPIEDYNPLKTFYASVYRKDLEGMPKDGFLMNEALSKQQTLYGMTIWAAFAQFDENRLGSLEKRKEADFVIMNQDWVSVSESEVLNSKPIAIYVKGEMVTTNETN